MAAASEEIKDMKTIKILLIYDFKKKIDDKYFHGQIQSHLGTGIKKRSDNINTILYFDEEFKTNYNIIIDYALLGLKEYSLGSDIKLIFVDGNSKDTKNLLLQKYSPDHTDLIVTKERALNSITAEIAERIKLEIDNLVSLAKMEKETDTRDKERKSKIESSIRSKKRLFATPEIDPITGNPWSYEVHPLEDSMKVKKPKKT